MSQRAVLLLCFAIAACSHASSLHNERGSAAGPSETVRLASINIENFGRSKLGKSEVVEKLAAIVREYSFIAVQEISDASEEVPFAFLEAVNADGASFGLALSPRSGRQPDDVSYQEQYAFYYDSTVLEPLSEGTLYDDAERDAFAREPYLVRFGVIGGGFSFVALTVHTQPDNAVAEIERLADVVEWARQVFPEEERFIILGDLNAGCSYASASELDVLAIRGTDFLWIIPDDADTNLAMSSCAYDRIIATRQTEAFFSGAWGVDASFTDPGVSDHWPVWAEFTTEPK